MHEKSYNQNIIALSSVCVQKIKKKTPQNSRFRQSWKLGFPRIICSSKRREKPGYWKWVPSDNSKIFVACYAHFKTFYDFQLIISKDSVLVPYLFVLWENQKFSERALFTLLWFKLAGIAREIVILMSLSKSSATKI